MNIPSVELTNTSELKPDGLNPNAMPPRKLEALKKNIQRYGFIVPIITNKELVIADGEHRWKAALALRMPKVPVIRLEVNEVDRRILRQVLNKLRGEHDKQLDLNEFKYLLDANTELGTGFDDLTELLALEEKQTSRILDQLRPASDEEPASFDPPIEPTTRPGDLWQLGEHYLYCGDATTSEAYEALLNGEKADLVVTDPPYGVEYQHNQLAREGGNQWEPILGDTLAEVHQLIPLAFDQIDAFTQDDTPIYVFHADQKGDVKPFYDLEFTKRWHMSNTLIWRKHLVMSWQHYHVAHEPVIYGWKGKQPEFYGERNAATIIEVNRDATANYAHPTQKPVALIEIFITNSSKRGAIVLDPFAGSGSTLLACERLHRRARCLELSPAYCDVIIKRWEALTGSTAKVVKTK